MAVGPGVVVVVGATVVVGLLSTGRYLYDVRKTFEFLEPFPPCPYLVPIYSTEFTQPPLLRPHGHYPLPPLLVRTLYKYRPYGEEGVVGRRAPVQVQVVPVVAGVLPHRDHHLHSGRWIYRLSRLQ